MHLVHHFPLHHYLSTNNFQFLLGVFFPIAQSCSDLRTVEKGGTGSVTMTASQPTYIDNAFCTWTIQAPVGVRIKVIVSREIFFKTCIHFCKNRENGKGLICLMYSNQSIKFAPTRLFFQQFKFFFFSSPELKAQVSYSDRPLSVVRLSVCPSVCL
jgi:hypothetical protein